MKRKHSYVSSNSHFKEHKLIVGLILLDLLRFGILESIILSAQLSAEEAAVFK
jgi:hypothetical protein